MYAKICNSEDDIMIDMSKSITFTDLRKRQNIRRNIYGEVYASDVIRPFRLQLIQR